MKTRIELVNLGLSQAGLDTGFQTLGREWLNFIIEAQAMNFDWPFFSKTQTDQPLIAGTTAYAVPTDFARPNKEIYLVQNGSKGRQVPVAESGIFELLRGQTTVGQPTVAMVRTQMAASGPEQHIVFDQVPSTTTLYYRLPYFRTATALSTSSTDDAIVPDFLNQDFLVQEFIKMAFKHMDDQRYTQQYAESKDVLKEAKFNSLNASANKIELAPGVYKGRTRGNGTGWMGP